MPRVSSPDWYCVSTDGSAQGKSEWFQMHFVSAMMKMAACLFKAMYLWAWLQGVCSNKWSQNNDTQSGLHKQVKGHGQINKCFTHSHTHTHTRVEAFWNYRYMWHMRQDFVTLYLNEREKAVISPCNLPLNCVCTNGAWSLSTLIRVIFTLSLSWQASAVRNS